MSVNDVYYCCFVNINQEKIINIPKYNEPASVVTQYSTFECGATFSSEDDLRAHLEKEHHCEERTEYECGELQHLKQIYHYVDSKNKDAFCVNNYDETLECERIYDTQEACINHYEESHMNVKPNYDNIKPDVEFNHGEPSNVEATHVETVNTEPNHVQLIYTEPGYIEDSDNLPEYCEEVYVQTELVKESKVKVKKKVRLQFICDICSKTYTSKTILRYHMHIHTGDRPYKCTMCPKSFTSPAFLQTHIRIHTGERPYKCPVCPKAFGNQAALWRHDRVHTGKKPYKCKLCSKSFTQSNSLKLHINSVHLKIPAPYKKKPKRAKNSDDYKEDESLVAVPYRKSIPITWP